MSRDSELVAKLRAELARGDTTVIGARQVCDRDLIERAADTIDRLTSSGEAGGVEIDADYLRKLVPGFRLDWSGLRNRFEEALLRFEKLTTYELRSAHLDELARVFEEAVTSALYASPREGHVEVPTHRHVKRGSEYVLIGFGKMQAEKWKTPTIQPDEDGRNHWTHVSIDMREVAIYRSVDDGSLWARPREEFEDGRFESLPHNQGETKP